MTQAPNKFIWYELMTTDQDVAETFYRAVVGWNMAGIPPSISSKGLRASLTCGATDHR